MFHALSFNIYVNIVLIGIPTKRNNSLLLCKYYRTSYVTTYPRTSACAALTFKKKKIINRRTNKFDDLIFTLPGVFKCEMIRQIIQKTLLIIKFVFYFSSKHAFKLFPLTINDASSKHEFILFWGKLNKIHIIIIVDPIHLA